MPNKLTLEVSVLYSESPDFLVCHGYFCLHDENDKPVSDFDTNLDDTCIYAQANINSKYDNKRFYAMTWGLRNHGPIITVEYAHKALKLMQPFQKKLDTLDQEYGEAESLGVFLLRVARVAKVDEVVVSCIGSNDHTFTRNILSIMPRTVQNAIDFIGK